MVAGSFILNKFCPLSRFPQLLYIPHDPVRSPHRQFALLVNRSHVWSYIARMSNTVVSPQPTTHTTLECCVSEYAIVQCLSYPISPTPATIPGGDGVVVRRNGGKLPAAASISGESQWFTPTAKAVHLHKRRRANAFRWCYAADHCIDCAEEFGLVWGRLRTKRIPFAVVRSKGPVLEQEGGGKETH